MFYSGDRERETEKEENFSKTARTVNYFGIENVNAK